MKGNIIKEKSQLEFFIYLLAYISNVCFRREKSCLLKWSSFKCNLNTNTLYMSIFKYQNSTEGNSNSL